MQKGKVYGKRMITNTITQQKPLEDILNEYLRLCKIKGLSKTTIDGYKYTYNYFKSFLGDKEIYEDVINDYISFLQDNGTKETTINSYIRKISVILKFGNQKGYLPKVDIHEIKVQKEFKETYTDAELQMLLKKPSKKDFVSIRNWCITWMFASTAIRRGELLNLKVGNVDMIKRTIALNNTKNRKCRYVPISSSFYEVLEEYLLIRKGESDEYLFATVFNDQMSTSTLNKELARYNHSRNVEKTGIHKFRHTFITNAVDNNVNVVLLQRITGHSTLKELNTYYNQNSNDMVDIIDSIAPKSDTKKVDRRFK